MVRTVLICVVVVAACKKAEPPPPAPALAKTVPRPDAVTPPDAAVARTRIACPTGDAKLAAIGKALTLDPKDVSSDSTCAALMVGGQPLWVLDAITFVDGFTGTIAVVSAADGKVLSTEAHGQADGGLPFETLEVGDLDGDGNDELLRSETSAGHGLADEVLVIEAIRDGKRVEIARLPVRSENTGAVSMGWEKKHYECQSTHELVADGGHQLLSLTGEKRTGKPDDTKCAKLGTHVYAWDGKTFAERASASRSP